MFKLCSSINVKKTDETYKTDDIDETDDIGETDEIVKQNAFSTNYDLRYNVTNDYNDYDLWKLFYLGPLDYSYNNLVYFFGKPRVQNNYNVSFKEIIWFIKFNNGNICSISKHYKYHHNKKYLNNFRICGNNRSVLKDLVCVLK